MKRFAQSVAIALALGIGALAHADYAGSAMTAELKGDLRRRIEDTTRWTSEIEGAPGDHMRPFTASSVRQEAKPGGGTRTVGWRVSGRFSTPTGRTYIDSATQPRRLGRGRGARR